MSLPFPGRMAPDRALDVWLQDRGWMQDGRTAWRLMKGRRVIIATMSEAIKTQLRRDARATRQPTTETP